MDIVLCMIGIIKGNIVDMVVDVIVNAANESMAGGGGVDGAIHAAAGPGLVKETIKHAPLYVSKVAITDAYDLPANWIIHTVGPVWSGGRSGEFLALEHCYRNAIELAISKGAGSIAFPAISAGVYGFPLDKAAKVAVETLNEMSLKYPELVIFMVCYTEDVREAFELASERLVPRSV